MTLASPSPVFSLSGIEKSFGRVHVLRGVDLALGPGEVHALLGENGAGKSTLMRIVLGLERPDRGTMHLDGRLHAPAGPAAARAAGIVIVPQERTLCLHLDVAENIVLGLEPSRFGVLHRERGRVVAERALSFVLGTSSRHSSRISPSARTGTLSVADQQLVEIARALAQAGISDDGASHARVLVLDEPTSSLGRDDAHRLFERVAALKEHGLAIILVTHFLGDVRAHADRYTVLRDGKVRASGDARTASADGIVRAMTGATNEARVESERREGPARVERGSQASEVLLSVKELVGVRKPHAASFDLRRGEVLGIAGLVGAGRTELLRAIAGLDSRRSGAVVRSCARGVGLLSEDRGGEGLMLARSIADNIALSARGPLVTKPSDALSQGARWMVELAIRGSGPAQAVGELSGGNQQKVQIARLLREDVDVLLVDEPTRGVDVASKAQILALVGELALAGKGIVVVSSQFDELVSTCHRIAVLRRGELGPFRAAHEWTEESLLLEASS